MRKVWHWDILVERNNDQEVWLPIGNRHDDWLTDMHFWLKDVQTNMYYRSSDGK